MKIGKFNSPEEIEPLIEIGLFLDGKDRFIGACYH